MADVEGKSRRYTARRGSARNGTLCGFTGLLAYMCQELALLVIIIMTRPVKQFGFPAGKRCPVLASLCQMGPGFFEIIIVNAAQPGGNLMRRHPMVNPLSRAVKVNARLPVVDIVVPLERPVRLG